LLIYPVIYVIWRKRALPREPLDPSSLEGSDVPGSGTPVFGSRRRVLVGSSAFLLTGILVAVYFLWSSGITSSLLKSTDPKKPVAEVTQDGVTISILSADGQIHTKENALQIKFKDLGGHPVPAENVKVELNMNMPGMVMHSGAKVMNDGMGDYKADLTPDMAGDWSVDVSYQGPQGPAKLKVPVSVSQ
jgi:hypothetical protein